LAQGQNHKHFLLEKWGSLFTNEPLPLDSDALLLHPYTLSGHLDFFATECSDLVFGLIALQ